MQNVSTGNAANTNAFAKVIPSFIGVVGNVSIRYTCFLIETGIPTRFALIRTFAELVKVKIDRNVLRVLISNLSYLCTPLSPVT